MWSLFPELIGPIAAAFVLGSLLAWILVAILLPRYPSKPTAEQRAVTRGP